MFQLQGGVATMAELGSISDAVVRAEAQQFEHGWIMRLRLARPGAPNQWYLLADDGKLNQCWSFVTPTAFLGTDSPVYWAWEHKPPQGRELPDMAFASLWMAMKDVLGWAVGKRVDYEIRAEFVHFDALTQPDMLVAPNGAAIRLEADGMWHVEMPVAA
jgi:hypothetical protein